MVQLEAGLRLFIRHLIRLLLTSKAKAGNTNSNDVVKNNNNKRVCMADTNE